MALKYNVGDKVRIKSLDWYNENKDKDGFVDFSTSVFVPGMSQFCGKIVTIEDVFEEEDDVVYCMEGIDYDWTDEMFEGLVEEETKPKFKVGDKIKLKSTLLTDIFGVIGYESEGYRITNISNGLTYFMSYSIEHYYELVEEENKIEPKFKVGDKVILDPYPCVVTDVTWRDSLHGFAYTVRGADFGKMVGEEDLIFDTSEEETYDFLKTDKPNRPSLNDFMDMLDNKIKLPEGYVFKDENGNVINTNKIVLEKKKKEYPKTYEECCEVLDIGGYQIGGFVKPGEDYKYEKNLITKISTLYNLIICRDAYWKIAGEEMGLDGPWEPDYNNEKQLKYGLYEIIKYSLMNPSQFAFPTAEMRDAFYENFKELIETIKT